MHNPDIPYLLVPESPRDRIPFEQPFITVGRAEFTDVRIPDSNISRRHCRFYRVGNTFWVQDWYSTGGIYYHNERVTGIQGLLAGEGISHPVRVGPFDVHVECPGGYRGDPAEDLAALAEWFDTLDNDFPDYQRRFWQWHEAMTANAR